MLKKAISILLVAIFSLNTVPIAGAVELEASQQDSEEECVETVVENIDLTGNELETYSAMQVEEVGIQFDGDIYQELDQFEPIKEETVGQMTICYYDPENLEQFYIPNVEKIIEFSKANQDFLITYTTENQEFVMVYYHPDGSYGFAMNPDMNTSDQVVEYSSQSEKVKVYQFTSSKPENASVVPLSAKEVELHPNMFPLVEESDEIGNLKKHQVSIVLL